MFKSRFMPCPTCGASVDRHGLPEHQCLPERRTDYEMFGLREEIARLEADLGRYLATASGRFSTWLAARQVRRRL
jgi:hypothetical protein